MAIKPTEAELIQFKNDKKIELVKRKIFALVPEQFVYVGDQINFNDPYEAHMIGELLLWANGE